VSKGGSSPGLASNDGRTVPSDAPHAGVGMWAELAGLVAVASAGDAHGGFSGYPRPHF